MFCDADKEAFRIYKTLRYDAKYRTVAKQYIESIEVLQKASQSFSKEQWKAIEDYQHAFMQLHNTMMRIALRKSVKNRAKKCR